ncbi:MAG: SRPBCC family protein [Pirellulales bacterium]|nr:SRPBCC family protein [Pirellulales bacterium]
MAHVCTSATVVVPHPDANDVFDYSTDLDAVPEYFVGYGPVPAIRSMEMIDGAKPVVGESRRIKLADGNLLREEIVVLERPRRHAYRVTGYVAPFSKLVRAGHGDWTFEPVEEGVRITWKYTYDLTSPLAWPLAWPLVKGPMRLAMQRALDRIAARRWTR